MGKPYTLIADGKFVGLFRTFTTAHKAACLLLKEKAETLYRIYFEDSYGSINLVQEN